jgi:hypothetical protein
MEMLSHMIYFHSNFLNTKMFSTCSVANLIVIHMCLYVKAIIWCGLTNILLKISRHHKKLPKFSWTTEYHTWHWYLVLNDSQEGKFENINWQVRKIKKLRIIKFLKNWTQNLLNMENNPNPYIISAHSDTSGTLYIGWNPLIVRQIGVAEPTLWNNLILQQNLLIISGRDINNFNGIL